MGYSDFVYTKGPLIAESATEGETKQYLIKLLVRYTTYGRDILTHRGMCIYTVHASCQRYAVQLAFSQANADSVEDVGHLGIDGIVVVLESIQETDIGVPLHETFKGNHK